jgi:hypothetical protein
MLSDISAALSDLVSTLNKHQIDYLVGGSVSSSLHGTYRTTNDIDVLLDRGLSDTPELLNELSQFFLIDKDALLKMHARNRAYNIFHEETAMKIDLFPGHSEFHFAQLQRAHEINLPASNCVFRIATAEDIILAKLQWWQKQPSERQISDICGVLAVNFKQLDFGYLKKWAEILNVAEKLQDLLDAAKSRGN